MATDEPLPTHLQSVLEDVAKSEGFVKPRFDVSLATKTGDNYLGVLYRVLLAEECDGQQGNPRRSLSLILKTMPANRKRREMLQCPAYFHSEVHMYRKVLPAFAELLADRQMLHNEHGAFPNTARCIDVQMIEGSDEESESTLVLQDMRPLGFVMHDRHGVMDSEHLRVVMHSLARLHATSFAMEQLQPQRFAQLRDGLKEHLFSPDNPVTDSINRIAANTYDMVKERYPEGSDGCRKVKNMLDNYMEDMMRVASPDPDGGNAISHGDCWFNNLLFKYSEEHKPVDLCFVDFQLSRYAPPVLDLLYLLYVCSERSLRLEQGEALMRDYHSRLTSTVDELLGSAGSGERLYSWDTMQRQLKRCGRFGFGMALLGLPLFLAENVDLPDLDSGYEEGTDTSDLFSVKINNIERDRRLSDIVNDMIDLGYV